MAKATEITNVKLDMSKARPFGTGMHLVTAPGWAFIAVPTDDETIKNAGPSSTGKTKSVATTRGFLSLPGSDVKVSLNASAPLPGGHMAGVQS